MVLFLAFYLIALAKWGKNLHAKNNAIKHIYGVLLAAPTLAPLFFAHSTFLLIWCAASAVLAYITFVYRPRWIVGSRW
jgi:hypothetical protein